MAERKTTRKARSSALGDDPLAWIANDATTEKTDIKKTKTTKQAVKKVQTKKVQAKKVQTKKVQAKKVQTKKCVKKSLPENDTSKAKKILHENLIKLDSVLVINDAQKFYAQLSALLESKQDITIDASTVEMLDTAILQLLLAFVIKAKAQNREVLWIKPSEEMISRVTTLNLQAGLGLDGIA